MLQLPFESANHAKWFQVRMREEEIKYHFIKKKIIHSLGFGFIVYFHSVEGLIFLGKRLPDQRPACRLRGLPSRSRLRVMCPNGLCGNRFIRLLVESSKRVLSILSQAVDESPARQTKNKIRPLVPISMLS